MKAFTRILGFAFLISIGFILEVEAQRVYSNEAEREIIYLYGGLNGRSSSVINEMLELTQDPGNYNRPSFNLYFKEQVWIEFMPDGSYQAGAQIWDMEVRNKEAFFSFDFSEEFYPKRAEFYIEIFDENRKLQSKRLDVNIIGRKSEPAHFTLDNYQSGARAVISGYDLLFTYESRDIVLRKLNLIDQYMSSFEDLDEIGLALNNIEEVQLSIKELENNISKINRLEAKYKDIIGRSFWTSLDYSQAEAESGFSIMEVRETVGGYLGYKLGVLRELDANQHTIYFDKGMHFYEKGKEKKARDNFIEALNRDTSYAPTRYMLAFMEFEEGHIDYVANEIRIILNDLGPKDETFDRSIELALAVKDHYLEMGLSLIGVAADEEVVEWFRKALEFCQTTLDLPCDQREFENGMKKLREASNSTEN